MSDLKVEDMDIYVILDQTGTQGYFSAKSWYFVTNPKDYTIFRNKKSAERKLKDLQESHWTEEAFRHAYIHKVTQ